MLITRQTIVNSLRDLATVREALAAGYLDDGCKPIAAETHCDACGFSYRTRRHVVAHRNACATPELHPI